jgi:hypothetical protein
VDTDLEWKLNTKNAIASFEGEEFARTDFYCPSRFIEKLAKTLQKMRFLFRNTKHGILN